MAVLQCAGFVPEALLIVDAMAGLSQRTVNDKNLQLQNACTRRAQERMASMISGKSSEASKEKQQPNTSMYWLLAQGISGVAAGTLFERSSAPAKNSSFLKKRRPSGGLGTPTAIQAFGPTATSTLLAIASSPGLGRRSLQLLKYLPTWVR